MAKQGTKRRPVIVRVQTQERAAEVAALCNERGRHFIAGIEPDKAEDVTDRERLLNPPEPVRVEKKPGRNAPCRCGSGKKYKRCCGARR